jgi:hypothetical protein
MASLIQEKKSKRKEKLITFDGEKSILLNIDTAPSYERCIELESILGTALKERFEFEMKKNRSNI